MTSNREFPQKVDRTDYPEPVLTASSFAYFLDLELAD